MMKKNNLSMQVDLYLEKEKEFWLEKIKSNRTRILAAYFSNDLTSAIKILQDVLDITENLLNLSFSEMID
ncbi:MAG: hypothetical protein ACXQS8_01545 [Candidatus Helarchaeales archaeon]